MIYYIIILTIYLHEKVKYTHTNVFDGIFNENVSVLDVSAMAFSAGTVGKSELLSNIKT
jgi:hypothetical protein